MKKILFLIIVSFFTFTVKAQTASADNVKLHYNVDFNGRKALKATYTLSCTNARGHELIPVLFIDRAKGVPHYYRDGKNMKADGPVYRADNESLSTYWNGSGQFIAIFNDMLNPLPGKNEYNARILVYDKTLGSYIGDVSNVPWISFVMEGAQPINQSSSGLLIDKTSVDPSLTGPTFDYSGGSTGGNHNYQNPATSYKCPICNGTGRCNSCGGTGKRVVNTVKSTHIHTCGICHGTGRCHQCHGTGKVR